MHDSHAVPYNTGSLYSGRAILCYTETLTTVSFTKHIQDVQKYQITFLIINLQFAKNVSKIYDNKSQSNTAISGVARYSKYSMVTEPPSEFERNTYLLKTAANY